jgi:glutaconate CoA-transferase, subunit B
VAFLGAAQIDAYAKFNSTVIGDYARPRVRLPGGGGRPRSPRAAKVIVPSALSTRGEESAALRELLDR